MPSKQDLRTWCRLKYGNDWHATNKAERLAEARAKLSEPGPEERGADAAAPAVVAKAAAPASAATEGAAPAPAAAEGAAPAPAATEAAAPPAAAEAAEAAAPPAKAAKATATKSSASVSAAEARTWCRQKYGKAWHENDKPARLAEARAALSGGDAVEASKPKSKKRPPPEVAPGPEATEAPKPKRAALEEEDASAPAEPTRALEDLLEEPGNATAYLAINKVVNAWNLLDFTEETTVRGGSIVPVYHETHERLEMIEQMEEVIETGDFSYENPYGSDDTEALLEAFQELSTDRQRLLHASAKRCVKKGAALGEVDVRAILEAGLAVKL